MKKLEQGIIGALMVLMMVVVLLSTIELGWLIANDILTPPIILLEIDELLDVFGFFLLVLISLELLETIKAHFVENTFHAEVVLEVAMIAIARKVIILRERAPQPDAHRHSCHHRHPGFGIRRCQACCQTSAPSHRLARL
jgi:uncharacterized membrane protein (DUF373 family)